MTARESRRSVAARFMCLESMANLYGFPNVGRQRSRWMMSKSIARASDPVPATVEEVRIHHGCAHVFVAQELLGGASDIAQFQQVVSERNGGGRSTQT